MIYSNNLSSFYLLKCLANTVQNVVEFKCKKNKPYHADFAELVVIKTKWLLRLLNN
jgi:hypothetical protein